MAHSQAQFGGAMVAMTAFGRYWIIALIAATASAIAANMFIGVPLGKVVDVLLALMLVALIGAEVYFAVRGVGLLISGRMTDAIVWLGAMVMYLLLVFPPLLAFDGYAYFTGQQISGSSNLYDAVTGVIAGFLQFPAQILSAVLVLVLNGGSAYVNYVARAREWLQIGADLLSIVAALHALIARGAERRKVAEAH